jgi:hypothetical protein
MLLAELQSRQRRSGFSGRAKPLADDGRNHRRGFGRPGEDRVSAPETQKSGGLAGPPQDAIDTRLLMGTTPPRCIPVHVLLAWLIASALVHAQ